MRATHPSCCHGVHASFPAKAPPVAYKKDSPSRPCLPFHFPEPSHSIPFFLELHESKELQVPFLTGRAASNLSSYSGELRPTLSASRCAQHHKEAFPQINFGIEAIGACARLFFFGSGKISLHRRHFKSGDPRTNSSLLE